MTERFTFFWHRSSPFSQWHPCVIEVTGRRYSSAEQYMMATKARLFGDHEAERRIMETDDPQAQKRLGRGVNGFDQAVWDRSVVPIITRGNLAKFDQNPTLKRAIAATHGTTLVEASPYDGIFGIGLKAEDPRALDRATWRGRNLLGFALTEVREHLAALSRAGN